jgi:hypothetical protein
MKRTQKWRVVAKLIRPAGYTITGYRDNEEDARKFAQELCVYGYHYPNPKTGVEEFTPPAQIAVVKVYPPKDKSVMRETAAVATN